MATAKKASAKSSPPAKSVEATALLRSDHKAVDLLFAEFEKTRSAAKKKALVAKICVELTVHAAIEEEIFYPAVQAALKDKKLVPEATVEHASLKELISQIKDAEPDAALYDAKVTVLAEYVKHHVKEEQNEMFPKVKKTKLNLHKLGAQLAARKSELMAHKK